jgi:hypothetical protein
MEDTVRRVESSRSMVLSVREAGDKVAEVTSRFKA